MFCSGLCVTGLRKTLPGQFFFISCCDLSPASSSACQILVGITILYRSKKKKKICCVYKRSFFKALYNKQLCFIFGSLEVQATNSYQCKYIFFLEITAPGNKTVIIFLYVGRILSSGKLRMNT